MNKNVLIAEDDFTSLKIMGKILETAGYDVTFAVDGKDALKKFETKTFDVVISDLEMPHIGGAELITEFKKRDLHPVVLVVTAHTETSMVVEVMKKGIYDYIVKPIDAEELILKVEKAFEIAQFRQIKDAVEKEYEVEFDKQQSWNQWKESIVSRDRDRFDKSLFYNLKTILSQGSGFGGLISIISLITSQPKNERGKYEIDPNLMKMVADNARMSKNALDTFIEMDALINTEIKISKVSVSKVHYMLSELIEECAVFGQIKNQSVKISDTKPHFETKMIYADLASLKRGFKELIINAHKFSQEHSLILIILNIVKNKLHISILNSPEQKQNKVVGIPKEHETHIFEPFYRISETVDERYETLDFGLGLTLVDKIIRKHGGQIRASNMSSHLKTGARDEGIKVNLEVDFSIVN